jgi:hypothetical protein
MEYCDPQRDPNWRAKAHLPVRPLGRGESATSIGLTQQEAAAMGRWLADMERAGWDAAAREGVMGIGTWKGGEPSRARVPHLDDARVVHRAVRSDRCGVCHERPASREVRAEGERALFCAECWPGEPVVVDREPAGAETALAFGARVVAPGLVARLRAGLGRWLAGKTEGAL